MKTLLASRRAFCPGHFCRLCLGRLLALTNGDARSFAASAATLAVHKQAAADQYDDEERADKNAERAAATTLSHKNLRCYVGYITHLLEIEFPRAKSF